MYETLHIGTGFDVHAFAQGRKLVLGGVSIPYERGLLGHSDADVLVHALIDALLGAARLGDIGELFPDTDASYKDANSIELLMRVVEIIKKEGFHIIDADTVVMAQVPKLSSYKQSMRERLACALGVDIERVGLKATTTEHLGFVGRKEGIAAQANVLLERCRS